MTKIKNIAIVAHVDHGKTTLVDALFRQSGNFREEQLGECMMDKNELERIRGITILAKSTSIIWKNVIINILDTPGHADFGSEVERVLKMVDCVILLVDAAEGIMPQTKFVINKALEQRKNNENFKFILIINKIDKSFAEPVKVRDDVMEFFLDKDPSVITEIPVFFGSGREGYFSAELGKNPGNIYELLDKIIEFVPDPKLLHSEPIEGEREPSRILVSLLDYDPYFGRLLIGKVFEGSFSVGESAWARTTENKEEFKIMKIFRYVGMQKQEIKEAHAGDIIAIGGTKHSSAGVTIMSNPNLELIESPKIDEPVMSVCFYANRSPLAGREGKKLTFRQIKDRLFQEAQVNVGIKVEESGESCIVHGRGELQFGVLIQTMRNEGFELMVGAPKINFKKNEETGKLMEPMEEFIIDCQTEMIGQVSDLISRKSAEIQSMENHLDQSRLIFNLRTRYSFGLLQEVLTLTKGTSVLNRRVIGYVEKTGDVDTRKSLMVSSERGTVTAYALDKLQDRGPMFVKPGEEAYKGMIVGINNNDQGTMAVNVCRQKQMSNMRSSGKDDAIKVPTSIPVTTESCLAFVQADELIEVTPSSIRMTVTERKYL